MKVTLTFVSFLGAVILFCSSSIAAAFPLFPGSGTSPGTLIEDDSLVFFENRDGNDIITPGDYVHMAFEANRIADILPPYSGNSYSLNSAADELVAWISLQVIAVDNSSRTMAFGPIGSTPMLQFFSGGSANLNLLQDLSLAGALAATAEGTALWAFSVTDDLDTYWIYHGISEQFSNPAAIKAAPSGTIIGDLYFSLNQVGGADIFDPTDNDMCAATICNGDGLAHLIGSASLHGGQNLANGAFSRVDADILLNPNAAKIPEPATFTLLGIGLALIAAASQKKK